MTTFGVLSSFACLFSCLLISRDMKGRVHNQFVLFVTLSDFVTSVGMSFGYCQHGSVLCWIQAILTGVGPLCSAYWTTLIAFVALKLVLSQESLEKWRPHTFLYYIGWVLPVILVGLPLTTNTFGCYEDDECWCYLADRSDSPTWSISFWNYAAFYIWIWGALLFYVAIFITTLFVPLKGNEIDVRKLILSKLIGYPIIITMCWSVASLHDIMLFANPTNSLNANDVFEIIFVCLPSLQGLLTSGLYVYFYMKRYCTVVIAVKHQQQVASPRTWFTKSAQVRVAPANISDLKLASHMFSNGQKALFPPPSSHPGSGLSPASSALVAATPKRRDSGSGILPSGGGGKEGIAKDLLIEEKEDGKPPRP